MIGETSDRLTKLGILPVATIDDARHAKQLADTLCAGGLHAIEVTFRTAAAVDAIREIASRCPDILVGAGTILSLTHVDAAIDAGASFVVSPGFDDDIVRRCVERGILVVPGAVTATEIMAARRLGITLTKFFPAEQLGGIAAIDALAAPFTDHLFMPTGGINENNVASYLKNPHVACCGGTWLVRRSDILSGKFEEIARSCEVAVNLVRSVRRTC